MTSYEECFEIDFCYWTYASGRLAGDALGFYRCYGSRGNLCFMYKNKELSYESRIIKAFAEDV